MDVRVMMIYVSNLALAIQDEASWLNQISLSRVESQKGVTQAEGW